MSKRKSYGELLATVHNLEIREKLNLKKRNGSQSVILCDALSQGLDLAVRPIKILDLAVRPMMQHRQHGVSGKGPHGNTGTCYDQSIGKRSSWQHRQHAMTKVQHWH